MKWRAADSSEAISVGAMSQRPPCCSFATLGQQVDDDARRQRFVPVSLKFSSLDGFTETLSKGTSKDARGIW